MAQQKLDLLQFSTSAVAEFGACSSKIMRSNMFNSCLLAALLNDIPNHILRKSAAPNVTCPADRTKDSSLADCCRRHPVIKCLFRPVRNRNGTDTSTFADEINDCPVALSHLNITDLQTD